LVDINYNEEYEKIIKELAKCNCKEDFEELIENNQLLKNNVEEFQFLINGAENTVIISYVNNKLDSIVSHFLAIDIKFDEKFKNFLNKCKNKFDLDILTYIDIDSYITKEKIFEKYTELDNIRYCKYAMPADISINKYFNKETSGIVQDIIFEWNKLVGYKHKLPKNFSDYDGISPMSLVMQYIALHKNNIHDLTFKINTKLVKILINKINQNTRVNNLKNFYKDKMNIYKKNWLNYIALYGSLGLSVILICLCCIYYYISGDKNLLTMYSLIAIKPILFVVGWIGFRNINKNKLLREEYHHKDNVMEMFEGFSENQNVAIREQITKIMLDTVNDNPNDKIIKRSKESEKVFNERVKNLAEIIKLMYKKG
jgi:hypothetical protein